MPASARDSTMSARTLKSAKVFSGISCGLLVRDDGLFRLDVLRAGCRRSEAGGVAIHSQGSFLIHLGIGAACSTGRQGGRSGARSGAQANPVEADRGLSKCWHWGPAGLSQDRVGAGLLNSKSRKSTTGHPYYPFSLAGARQNRDAARPRRTLSAGQCEAGGAELAMSAGHPDALRWRLHSRTPDTGCRDRPARRAAPCRDGAWLGHCRCPLPCRCRCRPAAGLAVSGAGCGSPCFDGCCLPFPFLPGFRMPEMTTASNSWPTWLTEQGRLHGVQRQPLQPGRQLVRGRHDRRQGGKRLAGPRRNVRRRCTSASQITSTNGRPAAAAGPWRARTRRRWLTGAASPGTFAVERRVAGAAEQHAGPSARSPAGGDPWGPGCAGTHRSSSSAVPGLAEGVGLAVEVRAASLSSGAGMVRRIPTLPSSMRPCRGHPGHQRNLGVPVLHRQRRGGDDPVAAVGQLGDLLLRHVQARPAALRVPAPPA